MSVENYKPGIFYPVSTILILFASAWQLPAEIGVYALLFLMLFLPLFDRQWQVPGVSGSWHDHLSSLAILLAVAVLLFLEPDRAPFFLWTLLFAALPEEWFFRAYLMRRIKLKPWQVNLLVSLLFSLLHALTRGWSIGLQVFAPSLFYGWVYQQRQDVMLLVLLHAISNLVFVMYLRDLM
ncbi:MAG: CPBP family intramembrane metalloprotease [Gammaproteobacteria bacterium]|nr:CPBP family intramembrane metalloprotease [Gammaproteobacteria bacterium]